VKFKKTAILGAGNWGTALAVLWAKNSRDILLWARNPALADQLKKHRENREYLPGIELPASLNVTSDLQSCADADLLVLVVPSIASHATADCLRAIGVNHQAALLSCTKGIEHGTGNRISQILQNIFPENPVAVLSGPNLAVEVVGDMPTATVLACAKIECAAQLQGHLGSARFRIYTTNDVTGVELGGALKNIFAIAAGVCDGFGLGDNTKAALLTRSLAEMVRLGTAMGGQVSTFYGLSGAGDLIATCYSRHSRNRHVGEQLGRGESLQQITSSMQMVAEGIPTTRSAYECARKLQIETPIIDQIYAILYEDKPVTQAMEELLGRDQKAEHI
jgi:glycerol-3-phosphate dehydrogenase (NAD(P)+)